VVDEFLDDLSSLSGSRSRCRCQPLRFHGVLTWTPPVWRASFGSFDSADTTAVLHPAYWCSPDAPDAGLDGHSRGRGSSPCAVWFDAARHSALPGPRSDRFAITSSTRLTHSLRRPLLCRLVDHAAAACAAPLPGLALCQSR
jgi:hypothetical protein